MDPQPRPENYGLMRELAGKAAEKFARIVADEAGKHAITGILTKMSAFSEVRMMERFGEMYLAAVEEVYHPTRENHVRTRKAYDENPRNAFIRESEERRTLDATMLSLDQNILYEIASVEGKTLEDILAATNREAVAKIAAESLELQHRFIRGEKYGGHGIIGIMLAPNLETLRTIDIAATQRIHDYVLGKLKETKK